MRKAYLKYLHVSGYEVTQVLPDKIELVNIRLARPESLSLHQLHEDTTWKAGGDKEIKEGWMFCVSVQIDTVEIIPSDHQI